MIIDNAADLESCGNDFVRLGGMLNRFVIGTFLFTIVVLVICCCLRRCLRSSLPHRHYVVVFILVIGCGVCCRYDSLLLVALLCY